MELVIEPTIVWMVHLGRGTPDEIEGTLSADEWELVFTDAASPETARFPFVDIVSVKRVLGSPVFTVGWRRGDETRDPEDHCDRVGGTVPAHSHQPGAGQYYRLRQ